MIISELRGRIGNELFIISAGLWLSKKINTNFGIKIGMGHNYFFNEIYNKEFFANFQYIDNSYNLDNYSYTKEQIILSLNDFLLKDNQIINSYYLGKNFVDYNTIKDIYVPSKELTEEIFDLYNPTRNTLMINIRRGDFLKPETIAGGWHSEPKEYWEATYKYLNKKYDKVLVTSDDIEWCKNNLDFCDNLIIVDKNTENSKIFFDLFLPTFVGDNVISASTFSWWGAYLNKNPNKIVIMPYPWNTLKYNWRNKAYYFDNTIKFDIYNYKEVK